MARILRSIRSRCSLISLIWAAVLLFPSSVFAQQTRILDTFPENIDASSSYLIYLHGRIIEDQGRRPTHPTWGVYEYQKILEALAAKGRIVISEQRPPSTDMDAYAMRVVEDVKKLLAAGVEPGRISVVGFSKGGGIALRTSALLQNPEVNFVFLAACGNGDFSKRDIRVWGRILSIYEASDEVGQSCQQLFAKSEGTGERSEVRISTGLEHGAFYRPRNEWLDLLLRWVERPGVR